MKLVNFSLSIENRILISSINLEFEKGVIHHILGRTGRGKTSFAKALVGALPHNGKVIPDDGGIVVIGNCTNLPNKLRVKDIVALSKKSGHRECVENLEKNLDIGSIPEKLTFHKLTELQKHKMKLLYFLSRKPGTVIFDEFTKSLDNDSELELYAFINSYMENNDVVIINLTQNTHDIEHMKGKYYLFDNLNIIPVKTKEDVLDRFLKGW